MKEFEIAEKIALIELISDKIAELEVRCRVLKDTGVRKDLLLQCAAQRAFYDGILEKISISL